MAIVWGVIVMLLVAGGTLGFFALAGKAWRGVPTSGHIADAHLRAQDKRAQRDAQNAAADEIIAQYRAQKQQRLNRPGPRGSA